MKAITYFDGDWHDGSPPVMGPLTQSFMHGSTVFDGARAFSRMVPDLDLHCARLLNSATVMGLEHDLTVQQLCDLAIEGVRRFPDNAELYIRPVMWAEDGFLIPEGKARFSMTLFEVAMPEPTGMSVCLSDYRRPSPEMAPTQAKAACLYPNTSLALTDAQANGYDNAVMRDGDGNVVEFGTSNLWYAKDGVAMTPEANGTFLVGVTRNRVIGLLRDVGVEVREQSVRPEDLDDADEIFSTGNLGKVLPITRYEQRDLQPGPVFSKARELYFDYAKGTVV